MNPFDFSGPDFLKFYLALGAVVYAILSLRIGRIGADRPVPKTDLADPYEIAFLRGGAPEALRVAVISLLDRGLLLSSGKMLQTTNGNAVEMAKRPLEKALLGRLLKPLEPQHLFADDTFDGVFRDLRRSLESRHLLMNEAERASCRAMVLAGLFVLGGTAITKLFLAMQRGRHNVIFLILLTGLAGYLLERLTRTERTFTGSRLLSDLRVLFAGLRARADQITPGGRTNELVMLAAVFGVGAVSVKSFPVVRQLFRRAATTLNSTCGASCGSDTSSCSSSCGSSCGGGGCGGGCGGCGS